MESKADPGIAEQVILVYVGALRFSQKKLGLHVNADSTEHNPKSTTCGSRTCNSRATLHTICGFARSIEGHDQKSSQQRATASQIILKTNLKK